jgi:hypothetical protein
MLSETDYLTSFLRSSYHFPLTVTTAQKASVPTWPNGGMAAWLPRPTRHVPGTPAAEDTRAGPPPSASSKSVPVLRS